MPAFQKDFDDFSLADDFSQLIQSLDDQRIWPHPLTIAQEILLLFIPVI